MNLCEAEENGYIFEYDYETGGMLLKKYTGDEKEVIIPSKVDGKLVTTIGEYAFTNIVSAEIPEQDVFIPLEPNENIEKIIIPDSVFEIRYCAFMECRELKEIILSKNLAYIGPSAFFNCSALEKIELPKSLRSILRGVFRNCTSLKDIALPKGITEIEYCAFEGCSKLEKVELNEGLLRIGIRGFKDCTGLKIINLPKTLIEIGHSAFINDSSLKSINIPKKIYKIEPLTFSNCINLKKVYKNSELVIDEEAFKGVENYEIKDNTRIKRRIFCFHHAGGNASYFNEWKKYVDYETEICKVQLPMREERLDEKMPDSIQELANSFVEENINILEKPFILLGHSMGSIVAFEVSCLLEKSFNKKPLALFVSAAEGPNSKREARFKDLSDENLVNILREYGQIDEDILSNKDFLEFYLPIARADFGLCAKYENKNKEKLSCPIYVLAGDKDTFVRIEELKNWSNYTNNWCKEKIFNGNHFYLNENISEVLALIMDSINT